jgi:hypothetical protein
MTDLESSGLRSLLHGLWLPLITPFRDGVLDEASLRRLVRHYAALPVNGLILAATSGEGLTLGMAELEWIVELTRSETVATSVTCRSVSDYPVAIRGRCATPWMRRRPGRSTAI